MASMHMELANADDVGRVPDGTIIRWLRIPGDETSEVVAFVRHETENVPRSEHLGDSSRMSRDVMWISPGGWQAMTLEDAGVTYPAEVLRWGSAASVADARAKFDQIQADQKFSAWPEHPEAFCSTPGMINLDTLTGGTWARETALNAAAVVMAGEASNASNWINAKQVTDMAEAFEEWLDHEPDPPTVKPEALDPVWLLDAVHRDDVLFARQLQETGDVLRQAQMDYGLNVSNALIDRIRSMAGSLFERPGWSRDGQPKP